MDSLKRLQKEFAESTVQLEALDKSIETGTLHNRYSETGVGKYKEWIIAHPPLHFKMDDHNHSLCVSARVRCLRRLEVLENQINNY